MNQKGSTAVALLIGLVVVFGGALGYTVVTWQAAKSDAVVMSQDDSDIPEPTLQKTPTSTHETPSFRSDNCETPEAQMVIAEKRLTDVHGCELKKMHANGKDMIVVTVTYGQGIDCIAGCSIPKLQSAIVDGAVVDALFATRPREVAFSASKQLAPKYYGITFTAIADYTVSQAPFYDTFIDFGDGQSGTPLPANTKECNIASDATCVDIRSVVHWYQQPGIYTATLKNRSGAIVTAIVELK